MHWIHFFLTASIWAQTPFPEAVLARRSFRRTHLPGADLRGVFAKRSDWAFANLEGADLRGAKLFEAKFVGAVLRAADLRDTDLSFADFRGADLRAADLSSSFFFATKLDGARMDAKTRIPWSRVEAERRGMRWSDED